MLYLRRLATNTRFYGKIPFFLWGDQVVFPNQHLETNPFKKIKITEMYFASINKVFWIHTAQFQLEVSFLRHYYLQTMSNNHSQVFWSVITKSLNFYVHWYVKTLSNANKFVDHCVFCVSIPVFDFWVVNTFLIVVCVIVIWVSNCFIWVVMAKNIIE